MVWLMFGRIVRRFLFMGVIIKTSLTLMSWLGKMGFEDIQLIDVSVTSTDEQRSTEWMHFHSLSDFLDPNDHSKSIEGHPAPQRAIVTARVPDNGITSSRE